MGLTATPTVTVERTALAGDDPLLGSLKALLSIDFDAHNTRLNDCLRSARAKVERSTGLLLSFGTVTVRWSTFYDYEPLPKGPVRGDVTATTLANVAITGLSFGGDFPELVGDYPLGIALSYQAGYDADSLPDNLAEGVRLLAANLFDMGTRDWWNEVRDETRYSWAS